MADQKISRFPYKKLADMPGSSTTPGRPDARAARLNMSPSATQTASAPGISFLSRLNGWPVRSPADASPTSSRTPAHGSGPMWIATPSSQRTHMGVFGSRGQVHRHIKNSGCCFGIQGLSPIS